MYRQRLAWAALLALGCGGAPGTQVLVTGPALIVVDGAARSAPESGLIRPEDPRIAAAQERINGVLGRELQYELDRALVAQFERSLHESYVDGLEELTTTTERLATKYPEWLELAKRHLKKLRWTYSPSNSAPRAKLDPETGTLEIWVPAQSYKLLTPAHLLGALERLEQEDSARRYASAKVSDVPDAELPAYLKFLDRHYRMRRGADRDQLELERTRRLLELHRRVLRGHGPELLQKLDDRLTSAGSRLRRLWDEKPEQAEPVRRSWLQWLQLAPTRLKATAVDSLVRSHLLSVEDADRAFTRGLNWAAFAEPLVQTWLRVPQGARPEGLARAAESLLCPVKRDNHSGSLSSPRYCHGSLAINLWHEERAVDAAGAAVQRKVLSHWLVEHSQPRLVNSAVFHLLAERGTAPALRLTEGLLSHPTLARAALMTLADFRGWGPSGNRRGGAGPLDVEPLIAVVGVWWKQHPSLRPELLYVLTTAGESYEGFIPWPTLPKILGSHVSRSEMADYLKLSQKSLWRMRQLRWSLSPGWSRGAVLIPHLESWLTEHARRGKGGPDAYYATERVAEMLCRTDARPELPHLQGMLRRRLELYPSERRQLGSFVKKPPSKLCPAER